MPMLRKIGVGLIIAVAAAVLGLVTYSFFGFNTGSRDRLILREGQRYFLPPGQPVFADRSAPRPGYRAPDLSLKDLNGRTVSLSDFRGRPVLLNFWASWCPPCRAEMPELQAFYERHRERVALLGVNWGEDSETMRAFLERFGVTYPNLTDPQGVGFVAYRLTAVPSSFFIDEAGIIRGVWLGPMRLEDIEDGFRQMRIGLTWKGEEDTDGVPTVPYPE